jgi:D-alanine-D-alanine ligase
MTENLDASHQYTNLKIAILYSEAKPEYFATHEHYLTEVEVFGRAEIVAKRLRQMGHRPELFPGNHELSRRLQKFQPDMAVNMVDSVYGKESLGSSIPGVLELLRIPYTGSGMLGYSINSNKYLTKKLLEQYGITTPKYQLISEPGEEIEATLDYPLIVKLNEVHGSIAMGEESVCHDERSLRHQIRNLYKLYRQPLLLEEFIVGREITVALVEGGVIKTYAAEKIFAKQGDNPFSMFVTFEDKWGENSLTAISYQKYNLPETAKDSLRRAYEVLRLDDYARFDIRLDQSNRHYVIDVNSNPAIGPGVTSTVGGILEVHDVSFTTFPNRLIRNTLLQRSRPVGQLADSKTQLYGYDQL